MKQWYLIENADEYAAACLRYEQVREAAKGSEEHREKMLLALLISTYEEKQWNAPDLDPIELIKIRMEEFGYTASDLAKIYGDKGTVSKVLHYKQALSLTMIRKFSNFLRIPPEALTREYSLTGQA
ncbi:MAG: helix-turn-helix domain-containing protein [Chitinophagaceae bacterium]|nr:helix-turn-helix domain-containing protein [Chitinophagaceae bacterium]